MRGLGALAVLLSATIGSAASPLPGPSAAPDPEPFDRAPAAERLRVRAASALALAGVGLAAWGASATGTARDDVRACRWCEPGGFDLRVRSALRWDHGTAAGDVSDALFAGVPLGSLVAVAALAHVDGGGGRELVEDAGLLVGAIALTDPLTVSMKHHAARLRPQPWEAGGPRTDGDLHSFFSGHTSRVFAAAAAATQIARMRGRPGWRWLALGLFGAAAATGWLRVAADQHWATDVLAGAGAGTAVGLALPALALRGAGPSRAPAVAPAPGGFALVF